MRKDPSIALTYSPRLIGAASKMEMAMQLVTTKKKAKGDRLNWTPRKDVKPVKLNADTIQGKVVDVGSGIIILHPSI